MNGLIKIGKLTRLHGIKGAVLLHLTGADKPDIKKTRNFFVEINQTPTPFFVKEIKLSGKNLVLSFDSVNTMEAAQKIIGSDVLVEKKNIEKEFRAKDLTGYVLHDKEKGNLGKVLEIINMPGQKMFRVNIKEKEVLLPYADDLIIRVDHKLKTIHYNAPEGLIDIYTG